MVARNARARDDRRGQRLCVVPWRSLSDGSADTGDYVRVGSAWEKKSEPLRTLLTPTITGGGNTSGWYYANDSTYNFPAGTFPVAPRVKLTPRGTGFIVAQLASITASGITYGVARLGAAPAANTRVELEAWIE